MLNRAPRRITIFTDIVNERVSISKIFFYFYPANLEELEKFWLPRPRVPNSDSDCDKTASSPI